jgi:pimeloyl-ACP methyl ester carboxylesterase
MLLTDGGAKRHMTPVSGWLQRLSIHGHTVAYRAGGEGPLLVLVHGMAGSSATWEPLLPALTRRFTVVAPDLRGHGASAKSPGDYTLAGHANVLRDLLTALGHERATLVGHSFGGGVVMQLAYQFPEHCERLVLVSSGGLGREVGPLLRALSIPGADYVLPLLCTAGLGDVAGRVFGWLGRVGLQTTPAAGEIARSYMALTERETRQAFFRTLRAVIDPGGQAVSALDRLYLASHVPTLIVWGARDRIIPASHGVAAHAAIPGSRLVTFEDAGHFPHCEAPERFAAALLEFMDGTKPTRMSPEHWRDVLRRHAAAAEVEARTG